MSSITIQGLVTDAKIFSNTQSMLFPVSESNNKLRLSNTKAPAPGITNKTALEFRNTELGGYRFVHSYSNTGSGNATPGTLTLEQFTGDASVGNPMFSIDPAGVMTINTLYLGEDITVNTLIADTSVTSPALVATSAIISPKIGIGITASATNSELQFDNSQSGRTITMWEPPATNNAHQYRGFGTYAGEIYVQLATNAENFKIYTATSSTTSSAVLTARGNGNLDITGSMTCANNLNCSSAVIGWGSAAPDSIVTINSSSFGFKLPAITTTNRNSLVSSEGNILYNSTQDALQCRNGSFGWRNVAVQQEAIFVHEVSNATNGGTQNIGWNDRSLNVVKCNEIIGCSLASNQITLPIGIFSIQVRAISYDSVTYQAQIVNVGSGATMVSGDALYNVATGAGDYAFLEDRITINSLSSNNNVIKIQTRAGRFVATNGLGVALGTGLNNIFVWVKIIQIT